MFFVSLAPSDSPEKCKKKNGADKENAQVNYLSMMQLNCQKSFVEKTLEYLVKHAKE